MRIAIFSAKNYERMLLEELNTGHGHDLVCFEIRYSDPGRFPSRRGSRPSACSSTMSIRSVLERLADGGAELVATRSTGFNHIDVAAATEFGIKVVRVTNYSPNSVAEFAVGLLLALNRKIHAGLQSDAGMLVLARRAHGFRSCRLHRGGDRHRQDRQDLRADHGWIRLHGDRFRRASRTGIRTDRRPLRRAGEIEKADVISLHCPLTPRPTTSSTPGRSPA